MTSLSTWEKNSYIRNLFSPYIIGWLQIGQNVDIFQKKKATSHLSAISPFHVLCQASEVRGIETKRFYYYQIFMKTRNLLRKMCRTFFSQGNKRIIVLLKSLKYR